MGQRPAAHTVLKRRTMLDLSFRFDRISAMSALAFAVVALEELISACPGRGALRECSIMEALIGASTGEVDGGRPNKKVVST